MRLLAPAGAIGGVVGLSSIAVLALFFLIRRRGARNANGVPSPNQMGYNPTHDQEPREPPELYNPAGPLTFPSGVSGGNLLNPDGFTTNPYQGVGYHGAAEL